MRRRGTGLRQLVERLADTGRGPADGDREPQGGEATTTGTGGDALLLDPAVAADAATALWRARRRLEHCRFEAGTNDARHLERHLRALHDALARADIRAVDHDGERFVPGLLLDVLAFQPRPDLDSDMVIETVRPAVYHRDRQLQLAEVIVGTPEASTADDDTPTSDDNADQEKTCDPHDD